MTALLNKPPIAAAQTRSFAELLATHAEKVAAHRAASTAYGQIETQVFKGEIAKDDLGYVAAEDAEGDACRASCAAWCDVLEAPVSSAAEAIAQFGVLLSKETINLNAPDKPIDGTPMDTDEALKRVLRNLRDHLLAPASSLPPPAAGSVLASWAAERDRLLSEAAGLSSDDPREGELSERSAHYDRLIRNAPCNDPAAALAKLEWLRLAFTVGETGDEERVLNQLATYLSSLAASEPDAELLALGAEHERLWAEEHGRSNEDLSNDELDAAFNRTREIAQQIDAMHARTLAGFRVQARVVAWRQGSYDQPLDDRPIEAAQLINDLMGLERWSPDVELKRIYDRFKKLSREDVLLSGHTPYPLPSEVEIQVLALGIALKGLRERSRHLRASTPETIRIKAIMALDVAATAATVEHGEEEHQLARSLIADVLGLPVDFSDADRDAFMVAEGLWPAEDQAGSEHAALLRRLGVTVQPLRERVLAAGLADRAALQAADLQVSA